MRHGDGNEAQGDGPSHSGPLPMSYLEECNRPNDFTASMSHWEVQTMSPFDVRAWVVGALVLSRSC
jgi:hypothetical protein